MTLPIDSLLADIGQALAEHGTLVLEAAPGAGKTTRVPLALADAPWLEGKKILVLEPRRVAARLAAHYMASLHGTPLGDFVGYQVRFERKVGPRTRVELMTDGLLTRRLQADPELREAGLVILDEFHERRLQSDLALVLLKEIRDSLRPDLRILVMSATLDSQAVARYLGDAKIVTSPGRLFPLDIVHLDDTYAPWRMAEVIRRAWRETEGDVLAFLPGTREIRQTQRELADLPVEPLFGDMALDAQERTLTAQSARRVILATNIAETSVTVPGVTAVVDSGLVRQVRMDPHTGAERLETVRISKASATQRAGRAGRVAPGRVYRMWSPAVHQALPDQDAPEMARADLAGVVLELAEWGIKGGDAFLDPPPASTWQTAVDQLVMLNALGRDGRITPLGKQLLALPVTPRLAKLVVAAHQAGHAKLGADLAALLSERDLLTPEGARSRAGDCDLSVRLDALNEARRQEFAASLRQRGIEPQRARAVDHISRQLAGLLPDAPGKPWDQATLKQLLLAAFPDRVAKGRSGQEGYQLPSGRGMMLHAASAASGHQWLIAVQIDVGETTGTIHWATGIEPNRLAEQLADQLEQREVWRFEREQVIGVRQLALGRLALSESPLAQTPAGTRLLLDEARKNPDSAFSWSEALIQWQRRLATARRIAPEWALPPADLDSLLALLAEQGKLWRSFAELRQIDLLALFHHQLDYATRQAVERLTPTHWTAPSGRKVKLDYQADGPPILAIKLQELFGVQTTPAVGDGRLPVLVHLLSPAGRPVQVTQDLGHFWKHSYHDVRRDLRGRYPKHAWPEDPASYQPPKR